MLADDYAMWRLPTPKAASMSFRALVVDDDPDIRALIGTTLALGGGVVYMAAHGADALREVQAHPAEFFSVILCDLEMPVMDGRGLVRALGELSVATPLMLVSAYGAQA